MDLVVETDIGHDPDDFFALCYLAAAGVNIRAITISPGDPDQIAIARLFCKEVGLDIPIGTSKLDRKKLSSGSIHHELLKRYKMPLEAEGDGLGVDLLDGVFNNYPDAELFVIGPVTSVGSYLKNTGRKIKRATMQGGFLAYNLHDHPVCRLEQFENKTWMPTFNLNGDRPNGEAFLAADIGERRMVGKNVCHTILYTQKRWLEFDRQIVVKNVPAYNLFDEASMLYFEKHTDKKFHDPTAAVLHLHPEIATWVRGRTVKMDQGWGTVLDPGGDYICADIDYDKLWMHLEMCR